MRRFVESDVEVFPLLGSAYDFPALGGLGECGRAGTDFAVDDVIFVCGAGFDCAVEEVFADVVHCASDFANLMEMLVVDLNKEWMVYSGPTSGILMGPSSFEECQMSELSVSLQ